MKAKVVAVFLSLVIFSGSYSSILEAQDLSTNTAPIALPGWTHSTPGFRDGEEQFGVLLNSRGVGRGSTVIAEIDGDSSNGLEVAVGSADGFVSVIRADGSVLWRRPIPRVRCRRDNRNDRLTSTPAVGELFGDGVPLVNHLERVDMRLLDVVQLNDKAVLLHYQI